MKGVPVNKVAMALLWVWWAAPPGFAVEQDTECLRKIMGSDAAPRLVELRAARLASDASKLFFVDALEQAKKLNLGDRPQVRFTEVRYKATRRGSSLRGLVANLDFENAPSRSGTAYFVRNRENPAKAELRAAFFDVDTKTRMGCSD